mgnify:CR=1 FL=1
MNNSKLTEWLLENDCPYEFDVVGNYCDAAVFIFTEKENEDDKVALEDHLNRKAGIYPEEGSYD